MKSKKIYKAIALFLALSAILTLSVGVSAAPVSEAVIDTTRMGSFELFKYDLTNAEKDGVWDSSYVSTGVRDVDGVEKILGEAIRIGDEDASSDLGNGQKSNGYAIKGVEFTYVRIADIRTYTESEEGAEHVEVLYGICPNEANNAMLAAMGVSAADRYKPADALVDGVTTYYYQSDVLIDGLKSSLDANSTTVKNALETYAENNGTVMAETDANGHTAADNLPLGLYLVVETKVPEYVTDTTDPFLVSLPMTSVNGSNAVDGGTRWIYDVTMYPKNLTGIPSLEKTVREDLTDTGKHGGSLTDITDGYAHTATASDGDILGYQIISTLPSITSASTYLVDYTFVDTLSKGISYTESDVTLEFFTDSACTAKIASWTEADGKFSVSYGTAGNGDSVMTIAMTEDGLEEINTSEAVYSNAAMVNAGYSDCTVRVTYKAKVNSDDSVVYGDSGNPNKVVLTWRRSNTAYFDTLVDDCHVFVYGIDLTKQFSDGAGNFANVEFLFHNDTDNYYVQAEQDETTGIYYVVDNADASSHACAEADATHFIPTDDGMLLVKGLEDDSYTITEVRTDNGYTLLKDHIEVVISQKETEAICTVYDSDVLGLVQNDPRYDWVTADLIHNMPQTHLEHSLLTASATVDENDVSMEADKGSVNALLPLTVVNTRGFDLPRTGEAGNWMYPAAGIALMAISGMCLILFAGKRGKKAKNQ